VASNWEATKLELVDFRQKTFLIKNWDPIFEQLGNALSDLSSMKHSPFYAAFETEAEKWATKLNRAQAIFDIQIDVQRRWVYLEGIFTGSADVQVQLAYQYKQFQNFDRDFCRLMREMKREDQADYWVRPERGLLATVEGWAETLAAIQKALSEYLEKQRQGFPRFYFVGDEDLLEIIGNGKNVSKVQRHLSKMFAGISAVTLLEDGSTITHMESPEGEVVRLNTPIKVHEEKSIQSWLLRLESMMRESLATLLVNCLEGMSTWRTGGDKVEPKAFFAWVDQFPAQIVNIATMIDYSETVEEELSKGKGPTEILARVLKTLEVLADQILDPMLNPATRKKYEQLITEMVHQRDVSRHLIKEKVVTDEDYTWLGQARFYFRRKPKQQSSIVTGQSTVASALIIQISRASFYYGFEYLGVSEKLVQTPLTDRAYLTLCEAMHMRLGGNPYGPAGTGKTESVKALGAILGRFVLVFNCDETFDFQAMGRILVGLCQCGAWGCFDEFNRLEERILSAVSQQILTIQTGLQGNKKEIALLGKNVSLSGNMGMFVTMNPGYAGRSNLPDNLKQLFRGIAMIKPDASLIGQVMLFSQGFRTSENVAGKVVMLFDLCQDQLSSQSHYDFGLRALKSVLRSSGNLKRKVVQMRKARAEERSPEDGQVVLDADSTVDDYQDLIEDLDFSSVAGEQAILVKSICGTIVPKLVSADIPLFTTLLQAVFPKCELSAPTDKRLLEEIKKIASKKNLVNGQNWIDKMMQLYEIQNISHGVIMVGPAGTGKSTAWTTLREAMETTSTKRIKSYVIDPKALSKDELYGFLDNTTLEWTDGVFTSILRKIIDNVRGEQQQTHWIIFDGDVDPEWAENLNSTLDDNKLFTLPNGERLALTPNIRLMFEVDSLKHATLATVSRCGMVWFSEKVIGLEMHLENYWRRLGTEVLQQLSASVYGRWKSTQETAAESIKKFFVASEAGDETHLIARCLEYVSGADHVMQYTLSRSLASMFCMLKHGISKLIEYNDNHVDFPLDDGKIKAFMEKTLVYAMLWGFAGDLNLENRVAFGHEIGKHAHAVELPLGDLIEYEPRVEGACWVNWSDRVPAVEMDAHKITKPDVVIQTVDTVRHTDVLSGWLGDHRPLILCGPPGAGKSMTLTSVLTAMPDFELVTLNFSSSTGIDLILRTLKHNCTAEKTPGGVVMRPTVPNKWLVIFCDEINLPQDDAYQTQHVITFLRQISEHGGFWRASDLSFVTLEKVQIIGACNPPEDAGRVKLTNRFLRHCPLMFVDFPSVSSLRQIYGTFNRALMKLQPPLRGQAEPLTEAMIEVYSTSQARFTPDLQPHYIYSPRELSRWVRAMFEAMAPAGGEQQSLSLDELVRLWLHEALRLFSDRLTTQEECTWTDEKINEIAHKHFRGADLNKCLVRPVLYSDWLSKRYESVEQEELREHIKLRLQVFREEELDVKLVIFDEVLAHILRIDRVLRQPMGHLLLVGASGGGKTVLSKFVSWMCGYSVFQIKVHKFYKAIDFDADLRAVLIRSGCQSEKVCFIFDESNVLDSAFLERMNALLASGEVPGLFEGADWDGLMEQCKLAASRDGLIINKEEALYKFFCKNVQRNLHVVFTMNPSNEDFDNRSATSPALFNRCVIDWFGEWSETALYQVGHEFTMKMQLSDAPPNSAAVATPAIGYTSDDEPDQKPQLVQGSGTERDCVVSSLVYVHNSVAKAMQLLARNTNRRTYITPRHFLDFISHYVKMSSKKRHELEEQQMHLTSGLRKLKETQSEVAGLRKGLEKFEVELKVKETAANSKLEQMMVDKAEAERKRDASEEIAAEISAQETQISERKIKVEAELAGAKPALEQAAAAVRDINKADLDQVSRFPNPPGPVKLALEPVVLMLGHSIDDWQGIRKVLRDSTNPFIKTILNYDINKLTEKLRVKIEKTYMTDPSFTFDVVYKASKACGPLVTWVSSVVNYSRIKNTVQPLIDEMEGLEAKADALKSKMTELTKIREELGKRIDAFKTEYSGLVGEAQAVKHDMDSVVVKCSRSESLLSGLATEQDRWAVDCEGFKEQIRTVTGDALLSAAFVAYIGYFNQSYRAQLVEKWTARLEDVKVPVRTDLSLINFLSHPGQRLEWKANELPDDDLCVENAIMMQTFNRYPLVIDPSGQAVTFLMKQYKDRKIIRTSFLDSSFLKHLEAALRFGNALLVEDVESLDPILNSVLNKEIFRQGGRVMITLGDKELDFSPSFVIFLATRDPNCHFTPDLCSRVTFINFTVTHSSLTTQCLSKVLKAERPEVDRNRSDMLKLQGEFRVRLRNLEDTLLQSLAAVKGNILDDDKVMNTLETLKTQSVEVMLKMAESDKTMEEIEEVSNEYRPFARSCSAVYFSLENLGQVHFLYQYSLMFFLDIADKILFKQSNEVKAETNPKKRLQMINKELFYLVYNRVARGLLHQDQIGFALRLAQCAREVELGSGTNAVSYDEMEFFLKGRSPEKKAIPSGMGLTTKFEMNLGYLLGLPSMAGLSSHLTSNAAAWKEFAVENKDVGDVTVDDKGEITVPDLTPTGWEKSTDKAQKMFHQMLVCKCLRPDRVTQAAQAFVKCVFGNDFLGQDDHFDFKAVVIEESNCYNPLLLVSRPGYDASSKVDALVQTMGKHDKYESMAMGSPEGYDLADRAVNSASRNGTWVLLKNVHLSINWLGNLEKRLHRMTHHADFRLFLTMELNEKVPSNLFRMSSVIIFEPPVGMKSSMTRMLAAMSPERVNKAPTERGRLYFLLAWVHSVILERLRYVPVGWTKGFEFGETDARCAMDAVDEWVDKKAQGKANLSPGAIPWDALQALLEQIIYGGRIDNEFDQARLHAFVTSLFTRKAYDGNFAMCSTWDASAGEYKPLMTMPDGKDFAAFKKWVDALPDVSSPELLGLPSNAESMLLSVAGEHMSVGVLKLQDISGGEEEGAGDMKGAKDAGGTGKRLSFSTSAAVMKRPIWMVSMEQSASRWLAQLPSVSSLPPLPEGKAAESLVLHPLYRCMQREYNTFRDILLTVHEDLTLVKAVLSGKEPANNRVRALFISLKKDSLPVGWGKPEGALSQLPTTLWMTDFVKRCEQMGKISNTPAEKLCDMDIWLGGMKAPEAFVAATRQAVAQAHSWSLEDVQLRITVGDTSANRTDSYTFLNLDLQGAVWEGSTLSISNTELTFKMPPVRFTWVKNDATKPEINVIRTPFYLDQTRSKYLFAGNLSRPASIAENVWSQRGLAITCWSS
jgi:dynein heavy chain 1